MSEQKFCKDCKHRVLEGRVLEGFRERCYRPQLGRDLVTGSPKSVSCDFERGTSVIGCTKDGQYFEPKVAEKDVKPSRLRRLFSWFGENGLQ